MKTLLRTLISLCLIVWIGGELFFPSVAFVTFTTLAPDTHTAGRIVGMCLTILHYEGLAAGAMLLLLLAWAGRVAALPYKRMSIAMAVVAGMLALTAISQFAIVPRMETQRVAAGGTVDAVSVDDPARVAFNRLHKTSEHVEELILVLGLILAGVVADGSQGRTLRQE